MGLIEVSREQRAAACEAVSGALIRAGARGATGAELQAATGLGDSRCRRAVVQLRAEGRARRDGERGRVYAVADDQGRPIEADDRRNRELAACRARREFEARRGYVAGELADAITLLDGRRVPPGLGGQAESAQRYLRQLIQDVRSVPDPAALESLVAEAGPAVEAVTQLLATVEAARRQAAADRVAEGARQAQLKQDRRALVIAIGRIEGVRDRVAAVAGWESYRAWEIVRRSPAVLGYPLLAAGKWRPRGRGLMAALTTTGEVSVSCPLTGAEAVFPATTDRGQVTVRADLGVLAGMLEDAHAVVAGELAAVDRERLSLAYGLVSGPALTSAAGVHMAAPAAGRLRAALPSAGDGNRQQYRATERARRETCGWCRANPAPGPGLPCQACRAAVLAG